MRTRLGPARRGPDDRARRASTTSRLVRPELPGDVAARARRGATIERVEPAGEVPAAAARRGETLAVHLRMTGNSCAAPRRGGAPRASPGPSCSSTTARSSRYTDIRRFGTWQLLRDDAAPGYLDARGSAPSRLGGASRHAFLRAPLHGARRRSRRCCSTSAWWPGSATSTPTRRCGARDDPSASCPARGCAAPTSNGCTARSARCCGGDRGAGRVDPRLPDAGRRLRLGPGAVRRLRPHRRAVPALWHPDQSGWSSGSAARTTARTARTAA